MTPFTNKLLLVAALVLTGCPAGEYYAPDPGPGPAGGPSGPGAGNGNTPDDLVGAWYAGRGHTSVPYDPATGAWGTPSGSGLVYVFEDGGSYTKAFQSYESNGGCTTGFTAFEQGELIVDGGWITTHPYSGRRKFQDTCSPSLNSDDPITELADEVFTWEMRASAFDPSATVLYLRRTDGAEAEFSRL